MRFGVDLVFKKGTLHAGILTERITPLLNKLNTHNVICDKVQILRDELPQKQDWWELSFGQYRLWRGQELFRGIDFLDIQGEENCLRTSVELAEGFLDCGELLMGRLYDPTYDFWQNVTEPNVYTANNRDLTGTKLVVDPILGKRIDISENPGRRIMRNGFVEAVGAIMWFNTKYFCVDQLVTYTLTHLMEGKIVRVTVFDDLFRSNSGHERDVQNELRKMIFNNRSLS